jgi:hypothetical protein
VRFPDWEARWGWRAVGARTDRLDGRRAVTVIYRKGGSGVHYTIVDGAPLPWPRGARRVTAGRVRAAVLRDGDAALVVWNRRGHSCILASRTADTSRLLRFIGGA